MKRAAIIVALVLCATTWLTWGALQPTALSPPPRERLVLSGVTVLNPGIERLEKQSVVVEDGRITEVRPTRAGDPDPTADLTALREWRLLIADGRAYPRATVDGWLESYREHFHSSLYTTVMGTVASIASESFAHH